MANTPAIRYAQKAPVPAVAITTGAITNSAVTGVMSKTASATVRVTLSERLSSCLYPSSRSSASPETCVPSSRSDRGPPESVAIFFLLSPRCCATQDRLARHDSPFMTSLIIVATCTGQGQQCLSGGFKITADPWSRIWNGYGITPHPFAATVIGAVGQAAAGFGHEGSLYLD